MSARTVRRIVLVVFAAGIAGMIVSSIAGNNDTALVAGLVTAAASLCLMVATAVAGPPPGAGGGAEAEAEALAAAVEGRVGELVAGGADEAALRDLVRAAVALGRARR